MSIEILEVKFMFSKKATKIDEIFTVYLTLWSKCQFRGKILAIFVAFLENTNFARILMQLQNALTPIVQSLKYSFEKLSF